MTQLFTLETLPCRTKLVSFHMTHSPAMSPTFPFLGLGLLVMLPLLWRYSVRPNFLMPRLGLGSSPFLRGSPSLGSIYSVHKPTPRLLRGSCLLLIVKLSSVGLLTILNIDSLANHDFKGCVFRGYSPFYQTNADLLPHSTPKGLDHGSLVYIREPRGKLLNVSYEISDSALPLC